MAKQRGGGRWDGGRLLSLTFDSHLAPSAAKKFSVHTALCIAIETFLLITTETSFPAPDKESSLPVETALHQPFPKPTSFFRSQPTSSSPPFFSFFTPPLFISTFSTFSSPLAQLPFYRSFFFISPFLFLLHFFLLFFCTLWLRLFYSIQLNFSWIQRSVPRNTYNTHSHANENMQVHVLFIQSCIWQLRASPSSVCVQGPIFICSSSTAADVLLWQ